MDWTSLVITLAIAGYGAREYNRREVQHKERIAGLRKGILPSFDPPTPALWRLVTTGGVALLLILFAGWLLFKGISAGKYFGAYAQIGGYFALLAIVVLVMLANLIGRYRQKR